MSAVVCTLAAGPAWAGAPFAHAVLAPPDVGAYVHITDGSTLRRQLTGRPVADWVRSLFAGGELQVAWERLAGDLELEPSRLLDTFLGRQVTLMVRPGEPADAGAQWVVLTEVDPVAIDLLQRKLRPRLLAPRKKTAVLELPEHDLLVARRPRHVIVGPRTQPRLFYEVIERVAAQDRREDQTEGTLAADRALVRGRELGSGEAGVMLRHEPPMGGWSVLVADLEGEQISVKHAAKFLSPPFARSVTEIECDFCPLAALESGTLITMMEPTDIGDGPLETYLAVAMGEPLISRAMRDHLATRRIVTVGEQEGRTLERPVDLLSTTLALCLEVRSAEAVLAPLDEHMVRLARRLNQLAEGAFLIDVAERAWQRDEIREIDLSPATSWFTGGLPIMKNIRLNWSVANGPHGTWYVIATHRRHLEDVVAALEKPSEVGPIRGRFDNVGTADGVRVGKHLESWSHPEEWAAGDGDAEALRATMKLLSEFASGFQRCRWRMSRPSRDEMLLDLQLILNPPHSAEPQ